MKRYKIFYEMFLIICFCSACEPNANRDETTLEGEDLYLRVVIVSSEDGLVKAATQIKRTPFEQMSSEEDDFSSTNSDNGWFSIGESFIDLEFGDDLFSEASSLGDNHDQLRLVHNDDTVDEELSFYLQERGHFNTEQLWELAILPYLEGEEYFVTLLNFRDRENNQVKSASVELPGAFTLSNVEDNVFSRSTSDIQLDWNNIENGISVEVQTSIICNENSFHEFESFSSDAGFYFAGAGSLDFPALEGDCDGEIVLRKRRVGKFPSRFNGGYTYGYQERRFSFTSVP